MLQTAMFIPRMRIKKTKIKKCSIMQLRFFILREGSMH